MAILKRREHGIDVFMSDEDVEGILAKRALLRYGEALPTGKLVSSYNPHAYVYRDGYWIDPVMGGRSSHVGTSDEFDCIVARLAYYLSSDASQPQRSNLRDGGAKLTSQIKDAGRPESPLIAEPVSEADYAYPQDKVVDIRKGLRLKKRV